MEVQRVSFQEKNPVQREFDCLRGRIIVLEGLVGPGKSRLCHSIVHYLNKHGMRAKYFEEFFVKDFLDLYLSDRKRYGFSFQIAMGVIRIERYRTEIVEYARTGGIALVDRFILGDNAFERMLYKDGLISEYEHTVYWNVLGTLKQVEAPDYTVFLKCTIDTCMERIKIRGIQSEIKSYIADNPDYLPKLAKCYEEVYEGHDIIFIDYDAHLYIEQDGFLRWTDVQRILRLIIAHGN